MKKLIFITIILGVAVGAAGFWYWQRNPYSKEILKLEILGPEKAIISQEVEYAVKYRNNGDVRLEEPRLTFEFPENTVLEMGDSLRIEKGSDELGDIYPGEEKTFKFKGRIFGKEGDARTAKAWLSYKPKNLQAAYESGTTFTTILEAIPITFDFDLPTKVESGRELKFSLNYYSTLNYPLTDLGVRIEYPLGFEFLESKPRGLEKNEWEISVLNKAEGGRIEIKGKLAGEAKEQRIFRAFLGIWIKDQWVALKEISKAVEISTPRLSVFQRINSQGQYSASPGDILHYEIFFRNISQEPFTDLFLIVTLNGNPFDMETIKTETGQFNKGDNSIVWDWRSVSKLKFLDQGDEGKVEFWINLKDDWGTSGPGENNVVLKDTVLVSQIKEEFEIKVSSKLAISQQGFFLDDVFGNTGLFPPKAGEETTYTIIWNAQNYYNDAGNVKVTAKLPQNARLTGKIFPGTESPNFSFDSQSREIVWKVKDGKDMEAGTGVLNQAPNVSFQAALIPSVDQIGQTAEIIGEARIVGEDRWTEKILEGKSFAITTALSSDSPGQGVVEQ